MRKHLCDVDCPGWAVFETNRGLEIQRCDACDEHDSLTDDDFAQLPEAKLALWAMENMDTQIGSNHVLFQIDGIKILISYQTPVAAYIPAIGWLVIDHTTRTSNKHIREIVGNSLENATFVDGNVLLALMRTFEFNAKRFVAHLGSALHDLPERVQVQLDQLQETE